MTYCVAISVNDGIIFTSDSRTNAGVDQISTYSKMHRFEQVGESGDTLQHCEWKLPRRFLTAFIGF